MASSVTGSPGYVNGIIRGLIGGPAAAWSSEGRASGKAEPYEWCRSQTQTVSHGCETLARLNIYTIRDIVAR